VVLDVGDGAVALLVEIRQAGFEPVVQLFEPVLAALEGRAQVDLAGLDAQVQVRVLEVLAIDQRVETDREMPADGVRLPATVVRYLGEQEFEGLLDQDLLELCLRGQGRVVRNEVVDRGQGRYLYPG